MFAPAICYTKSLGECECSPDPLPIGSDQTKCTHTDSRGDQSIYLAPQFSFKSATCKNEAPFGIAPTVSIEPDRTTMSSPQPGTEHGGEIWFEVAISATIFG